MAETTDRAIAPAAVTRPRPPVSHAQLAAGVMAVVGFTVATLSLQNEPDDAVAAVMMFGAIVTTGFGLVRIARDSADRLALVLVAAGAVWSITTLTASENSGLYSIGRVSIWMLEPLIVALVLSYPHGHLVSRFDRRLVALSCVVSIGLTLASALIAPFPTPTPWASCGMHCPSNAFQVADGGVASAVDDVFRALRESLTVVVFAAAAVSVALRARRSGPLLRASLDPVGLVATMRAVALTTYFVARVATPESTASGVSGWLIVVSLPTLTLAFGLGMMARRLFVANALERLSCGLDAHATPRQLRAALASSLMDPRLDIAFRARRSGGWVDDDGHRMSKPTANAGRVVTLVGDDNRPLAAVVHDGELAYEPKLMDAAGAYIVTAMENDLLVAQLRSSLKDLSESRARIASAADEERRRIERDLHDGAQQHLVALRIKLELLASRLDEASPEDAAQLRLIEDEVETTLDEVRGFARGVYPPLLSDRGLKEALRSAARATPIPTTLDAPGIRRYPPEIESAVYFSCMEALQNATKHARGATWVRIALSTNGRLRFTVRDDGAGFEPDRVGHRSGLAHMEDRVAAVGGTLTIDSAPGRGTRVTGTIPLGDA